jgi:hypothetical protein
MSESTTGGAGAGVAGDVQNQLLELIEQGQEAIVDAVRQWRETGERLMPDLLQPDVSALPPDAQQWLAGQFDFAERLLAAQRRFAEELLVVLGPSVRPEEV